MYVTIRVGGYLLENKYFEIPAEATKFASEQREEARKNRWSIQYEVSPKRDLRHYIKPQKKGKKNV